MRVLPHLQKLNGRARVIHTRTNRPSQGVIPMRSLYRAAAPNPPRSGMERLQFFLSTYADMELRLHDICAGTWGVGNILERVRREQTPVVFKHADLFESMAHFRNRSAHGSPSGGILWIPEESQIEDFAATVAEISKPREIQHIRFERTNAVDGSTPLAQVVPQLCTKLGVPFRDERGELHLLTLRTAVLWLRDKARSERVDLKRTSIAEVHGDKTKHEPKLIFSETATLNSVRSTITSSRSRSVISRAPEVNSILWPSLITANGQTLGQCVGLLRLWDVARFTPPYSAFRLREKVQEGYRSDVDLRRSFMVAYEVMLTHLRAHFGPQPDPLLYLSLAQKKIRVVRDQLEYLKAMFGIAKYLRPLAKPLWTPSAAEVSLFEKMVEMMTGTQKMGKVFKEKPPVYGHEEMLANIIEKLDKETLFVLRRDNDHLAILTLPTIFRWMVSHVEYSKLGDFKYSLGEIFKARGSHAEDWIFLDPNDPLDVARMRFDSAKIEKTDIWACILTPEARANASPEGIITAEDLAYLEVERLEDDSCRTESWP